MVTTHVRVVTHSFLIVGLSIYGGVFLLRTENLTFSQTVFASAQLQLYTMSHY